MKKLLMFIVVITILITFPMSALAANSSEINTTSTSVSYNPYKTTSTVEIQLPILGSDIYDRNLDVKEVTEIRYSTKDASVRNNADESESPVATLVDNSVLYIYSITQDQTNGTVWIKASVDSTGNLYYINFNDSKVESTVEDGYIEPSTYIASKQSTSSDKNSTVNSDVSDDGSYQKTFRITAYCSACNSPKGSCSTASGATASWGTVACNDLPLGTHLYIPGYGDAVVQDRCARSGVIDVWIGDCDTCHCSSSGFGGRVAVTIYN